MAKRTDVGGGRGTATPPTNTPPDLPTSTTGTSTLGANASGTAGASSGVSGSAGATGNLYGNTGSLNNPGGGTAFSGTDLNQPGEGHGVAHQAKDQAKNLANEAKDQTKKLAGQARDQVQEIVERQKDQAADRLGSVAQALREAGRKLNEGEQSGDFGHYADRAAEQVERLSHYLQGNDLRGFVRDTENFARRRPDLFLGGTFLAGLMLGRFLRSSAPERPEYGPYSAGYQASTYPNRSSYAPERRNPDQSTVATGGTTAYNAPIGV